MAKAKNESIKLEKKKISKFLSPKVKISCDHLEHPLKKLLLMFQHIKTMTKKISNFNWKVQALGDHAIQFYLPQKMDPAMIGEIKYFNDFIFSKQLK